jgi:UDP-glucose 4-epimerase
MFNNKKLLIAGTFGNTVLKWFLETHIAEIRVFSRDEKSYWVWLKS